MSVQPSQASVQRGQNAAFVVAVSTENGSAAGVSVTLTAQPSSQKPTFTSGCATGNKTVTCTVGSVSDRQAVDLHAQIPVAAGAISVSSVTLTATATASVVTTVKWTLPSAAQTVAVTSVSAAPAKSPASAAPAAVLPLGPLPDLNGVSSSLIGAGNVAGLFPAFSPSAGAPSPSPTAEAQGDGQNGNAAPVSDSLAAAPVFTAQIAGLIAVAVGILIMVTSLSLRRRLRSRNETRKSAGNATGKAAGKSGR